MLYTIPGKLWSIGGVAHLGIQGGHNWRLWESPQRWNRRKWPSGLVDVPYASYVLHAGYHCHCICYECASWQKLCEGTKGLRWKVWSRTKILSSNIRYFVAILKFVAIYAFYKASFCPDSDERELPFIQTQILSSRFRRKTAPFLHTQTKDSVLSSRLRRKIASFRPDSGERQLPFIQTHILSSRFRHKTAPFVHTQMQDSFLSSRIYMLVRRK